MAKRDKSIKQTASKKVKKSTLSKKKTVKKRSVKAGKSTTPTGYCNHFIRTLKQLLLNLIWNRVSKSILAMGIAFLLLYGSYLLFIKPYAYRWMPCYGNRSYGVCMPFKYSVHGLDVSRHQGVIEWDSLKANIDLESPLNFVFIKATEGGDFSDVNFISNFKSAKRVNLIRGAYHFFTPKTSAKKQAEFFIENVQLEKGDLPPVLDVEIIGKHSSETICDSVLVWLDIVEKHYKVKPILYTSFKFRTKYLNSEKLDQYPFWIAHYYVDRVRYTGKWDFWQHSDRGVVKGIDRLVDLNVFNGTIDQLKALTMP